MQFLVDRGIGIAFWLVAMAAQMSGFTNTAIALALVGFATFFAVAPICHHAHAWHKRRIAAGYRSVEPTHILMISLAGVLVCAAVALGAVLWQMRTASHPVTDVHLPQTANVPGQRAPLKKMLTAYDVKERLTAIDILYSQLDTYAMQASSEREKLAEQINQKITDGAAVDALETVANNINGALLTYFRLAERYRLFPDINHVAADTQWPPNETVQATLALRAELIRISKTMSGEQASEYMKNNRYLADFIQTGNKLWPWIDAKKTTLIKKRQEYENAEVYP